MPDAIGLLSARPGQELNLLAGQLYVGAAARAARTLLGSCVGIAIWHPVRRVGGLCHYLLPSRRHQPGEPLDARFGEEAMHLMVDGLARHSVRPSECEAHLYGGADTLGTVHGTSMNVGERNVEHGWKLIDHHGFQLVSVDVGDQVHRHVAIDLVTGQVNMRRGPPQTEGDRP